MNISEILNLFRQGKTTAKSHMKNLIEMAAADGHFDDLEFDLLKVIAKRNNITEGQLKSIQSNPSKVKFEVPNNPSEKFHQLYDLVHMMTIDDDVHSEEVKLCNLFAVKFGYPKEKAGDLIAAIQGNIRHGQNADEAMKRVVLMLS